MYHSSCAGRVTCCGNKLNNLQSAKSTPESTSSSIDEKNPTFLNEDLVKENEELKKANKILIDEMKI